MVQFQWFDLDATMFDPYSVGHILVGTSSMSDKEAHNNHMQMAALIGNLAIDVKDVNYKTDVLKSQEPWLDKSVLFQPRYKITKEPINEGLQTSVQDVVGGMAPEQAAKKFQSEIDRTISS